MGELAESLRVRQQGPAGARNDPAGLLCRTGFQKAGAPACD